MSGEKEKEEEMEHKKGRKELHLKVINNFNIEQEKNSLWGEGIKQFEHYYSSDYYADDYLLRFSKIKCSNKES